MLERGWSLVEAAEAAGVSERTCSKWIARYRVEGEPGLQDRSSAPKWNPHRTPEELVEAIAALRRLRMTGAEIALCLAGALDRLGGAFADCPGQALTFGGAGAAQSLRAPPRGRAAAHRCQKAGRIRGGAGHRMLGRGPGRHSGKGAGWEFVHVCIDDAARLAYVEILADEKATSVVALLRRAVAFYRRHGITVERVMTDNGSAYRSALHALACRALSIRHLRTGPTGRAPRQGRALHPHHARRLGLRRALRLKPRTRRRP